MTTDRNGFELGRGRNDFEDTAELGFVFERLGIDIEGNV